MSDDHGDDRPLTPESRKRETFAAGLDVTLADGRTWTLAPPVLGFGFIRREGKTALDYRFVDGYADLLDAYLEADEPVDRVCALADAAYALLATNYDVTFDEVGSRLLRRLPVESPDYEVSVATWLEIAAWVVGDRPKVTADG